MGATAMTPASSPARRRRGRRAGSSSVEFALISATLMISCVGSIDLGLLLWSQEVLELAATDTARCVALGASPCTNAASYAVGLTTQYGFSGMVTTANNNVWVATNAACNSTRANPVSGANAVVTITESYWATYLSAFEPVAILLGGSTERTVTACYPMT